MNFNTWRKEYDSYSLKDQQKIINDLEERYPNQKQFTFSEVDEFISENSPQKVLEIGGWKGHLAHEILKENKTIELWHNYEICSNAKDKSVCKDERYKCIIAPDFVWNLDVFDNYDVCILSHVVEHIKEPELRKLFKKLKNIRYFYIEAPIEEDGQRWGNYQGTHILKCGWNSIKEMLVHYEETIINENIRTYRKLKSGISYCYFTYNMVKQSSEEWVRESFDSIRNQSDDIMIVDYSSDDNIEKIAKEYGFRFFRIDKVKGIAFHDAKLWNKGIHEAKYDLFVPISPDCIYEEDLSNFILEWYKCYGHKKYHLLLYHIKEDIDGIKKGLYGFSGVFYRPYLLKIRGCDERTHIRGGYERGTHRYTLRMMLEYYDLKPFYTIKNTHRHHEPRGITGFVSNFSTTTMRMNLKKILMKLLKQ